MFQAIEKQKHARGKDVLAVLEREAKLMKPYIVLVHKDGESAYGMSFPDAPGCFSTADELDDVFAHAAEVLGLWLDTMNEESRKAPEPCDLSDIKNDSDWTESFADAVLVIAVARPNHSISNEA